METLQGATEPKTCGIHVRTDEIPDFRRVELAHGALDLVKLVFADPRAEARYQAWLAERQGRKRKLTKA